MVNDYFKVMSSKKEIWSFTQRRYGFVDKLNSIGLKKIKFVCSPMRQTR